MKTLLIILAMSFSLTSIAGDRDGRGNDGRGGRIDLRDGSTIVRINIGDERETDTRAMMKRVANLERAVRELQNRVYDLEDDAKPVTKEVKIFICTATSNFGEKSIGQQALTETEARASAVVACTRTRNPMFCEDRNVTCESRIEVQRL